MITPRQETATDGQMLRSRVRSPGSSRGRAFCYDSAYRHALGARAWRKLDPAVRCRFSVRPVGDGRIRYRGRMSRVELSIMGWCFAQACRLIGTPLAPYRGQDVPMEIELGEVADPAGVAWRRTYFFAHRPAFTVVSTKSHGLSGGLTEHIGSGFSMRLKLAEESGSLVFRSVGYDMRLFGRFLQIPNWLTPGVTTVAHEQLSGDRFRFVLSVRHPVLGQTIYQEGEFYSD